MARRYASSRRSYSNMGLPAAVLCLVLLFSTVSSFYLPGVAPYDYKFQEEVALKVNKLTSSKTQLSYDYYKLPFCRPETIVESRENLGEILTGNLIQNSPYKVSFLVDSYCNILCRRVYPFFQTNKFVQKIKEYYIVNFIVDNLPSALRIPSQLTNSDSTTGTSENTPDSTAFFGEIEYFQGFPIGGTMVDQDTGAVLQHFLNNHLRIIIKYHSHENTWLQNTATLNPNQNFNTDDLTARIVGLDVEPFSIKHKYEGTWDDKDLTKNKLLTCPGQDNPVHIMTTDAVQALDGFDETSDGTANPSVEKKSVEKKRLKKKMKEETEVVWTYDIVWESSDTKWATRWDVYLNANAKQTDEVHWFAIVNSLLIVVFLTGMVAMIMLRTLHRDLTRYNRVPTDEEKAEDREESGWKLVHGDVFRAPQNDLLFSVLVGTGAQLLALSFITLIISSIGFLSPANRGSLMLTLLLLFCLFSFIAGFVSAHTYKSFSFNQTNLNSQNWQKCTLLTAVGLPGFIFGNLFFMDLVVWAEGSSNAVPFLSIISVMLLWFGISVPLCFLGSFYGYKKEVAKLPVKVQDIERVIPPQSWYMTFPVTVLLGGVLPFGAVFVELFFILSSIWLEQYYYVFGFLFIVFIILIITCAEISIVLTYFQLCAEDHKWHWRSFMTSASSAVYLFLYSVVYFVSRLSIDNVVSAILYFEYMALVAVCFGVLTGTVGYLGSEMFVRKIYGAVKVD